MAVEDKVRRAGTVSVTYPWMRRYLTFGLVDGSLRRTFVASITTRLVNRTAESVSARRRRG
jgi:hypothetical protein